MRTEGLNKSVKERDLFWDYELGVRVGITGVKGGFNCWGIMKGVFTTKKTVWLGLVIKFPLLSCSF